MNDLIELFKEFKENRRILIETGTYKGNGIRAGLAAGFEKVFSFEICREQFLETSKLFQDDDRVFMVNKSSVSKNFANLVKSSEESCVFWLDAHLMAPGGEIPQDYPLKFELEAIGESKIPHAVLMDDFRLFDRYGVAMDDVIRILSKNCERYRIVRKTVKNKYPDDVLCFLPETK
jgi:hypothetical protein